MHEHTTIEKRFHEVTLTVIKSVTQLLICGHGQPSYPNILPFFLPPHPSFWAKRGVGFQITQGPVCLWEFLPHLPSLTTIKTLCHSPFMTLPSHFLACLELLYSPQKACYVCHVFFHTFLLHVWPHQSPHLNQIWGLFHVFRVTTALT